MQIFEILTEVRYEDIYPKAFVQFREKWAAVPREQWEGLYVNFGNFNNDALQKTAYKNPADHHDPAGIYAYPLDYVIDNPSDVWYGQQAKYLRLMRSRAANLLDLQQPLSEEQAIELLDRTVMKWPGYHWGNFPQEPSEFLKLATERFKFKGANRFTKAMFAVVQNQLQYYKKTVAFTASEQTKRLRMMGFDAVEDKGTEASAVIHWREPEQIIFLTRNSFSIIETVVLRAAANPDRTITVSWSADSFRKLAAMLCAKIGDAPKSDFKRYGTVTVYTRQGRKFELWANFANTGTSSIKGHRVTDTDTRESIRVKLFDAHGEFEKTYPQDWTFEQIANQFAQDYVAFGQTPAADFTPFSLVEDQPEVFKIDAAWKILAKRYGVPWPAQTSEKTALLLAKCTQDYIDRMLHGPWASNKRFKPDAVIVRMRVFWAEQKNAALLPSMEAILTKLAKDRKMDINKLGSITSAAGVE
jgi:hypothetical protein